MSSLSQAVADLNTAVSQIGGIDAAIEACDRMYSAMFRGEPVKLSDCDDWEGEAESLKTELALALYSAQEGVTAPQYEAPQWSGGYDEDISDHELDMMGYADDAFQDSAERWFDAKFPDYVIDGDTLVVDFCNYKGEGEGGLGLHSLNKHLPIFRSKRESFNQVNIF